jgi:hypothetical protein
MKVDQTYMDTTCFNDMLTPEYYKVMNPLLNKIKKLIETVNLTVL